ncbi:MAG TPA: ATP-dependent DNA helicase RecG, partial [Acidimicrobiales bacterium]
MTRPRRLAQLDAIPVDELASVGPRRAEALHALGISTVLDLLCTYPRRYIDRSRQADLSGLAIGDEAVVMAEVQSVRARRTQKGRSLVEVHVVDQATAMTVTFFNQPWRAKQLAAGVQALFFGKLDEFRGTLRMVNPVVDVIVGMDGDERSASKTMRVIPVYPASAKAGLTSWELSRACAEALRRAGEFADPLDELRDRLELVTRTEAMQGIHAPSSIADTEAARARLVFDELFRLQLSLVARKAALAQDAKGIAHPANPADALTPRGALLGDGATLVARFLAGLAYEATGAQRRAIAELLADMSAELPMHRLLQGDVGAGKTIVAVATLLAAVDGRRQGALMVPTEVLAEQHVYAVRTLLEGLSIPDDTRLGASRPVAVSLLTSRVKGVDRRRTIEGLKRGSVDLVVGTHALLTDDVRFHALGAVVIDEQHRFGVEQRAALRDKATDEDGQGADPDVLVMTATPIPRTAAMIVFGDLDMTVLDELPAGRVAVETRWARGDLGAEEAFGRVRAEVAAGHQVFVVCPLVEGSDKIEAASATAELERLREGELKGLRLGLLHGQLRPADKESVMDKFRAGALDVLVATTVIEVGVDVPDATVMVIEDAHRFGIAQLHQLRGRVGRSTLEAWCYLLGEPTTPDGTARLEAVESTTDGFVLAERDLELRGEGTILGARQQGRSDLRLARLSRDRETLELARRLAEELLDADPELAS